MFHSSLLMVTHPNADECEDCCRNSGSDTDGWYKSIVRKLVVHCPQRGTEAEGQEKNADVGQIHDVVSQVVRVE